MSRTLEQFIRFTTDSGTCSNPLSNGPTCFLLPLLDSGIWITAAVPRSRADFCQSERDLCCVAESDPLEILFLRHDHWNPEASARLS